MKSASELPNLEKFSKCWNQTQGSKKSAFNKRIQIQADKAKEVEVVKLASFLLVPEPHLNIKRGREPRVSGSVQKRLKT